MPGTHVKRRSFEDPPRLRSGERGAPTWWLDVPLGRQSGREGPTWGSLAQRFDRCVGRVAFYVGQRVHDRRTFGRIVTEALEKNLDLLVAEHDELEELRRLRATADHLIATSLADRPAPGGSRP